jgi:hypothetical protein
MKSFRELLSEYGVAAWAVCAAVLCTILPAPANACTPWSTGVGLTTGHSVSPPLMWAAVWCPPASGVGPYRMRLWWVRPGAVDVLAFRNALARKDEAWLAAQITDDLTDEEGAVINAPSERALRISTRPVALVAAYTVAPNGLTLTRPAYALTTGVRGTVAVGRADVGAACDPAKARSGDYMTFGPLFAADRVALCK